MSAISKLRQLGRDTRGMSTVEYAVLLVLIVAGAVGIWKSIGHQVVDGLNASNKAMSDNVQVYTGQGSKK